MSELKFNINAMAAPSTPAEWLALLQEAQAEADNLGEHIDASTALMEAAKIGGAK